MLHSDRLLVTSVIIRHMVAACWLQDCNIRLDLAMEHVPHLNDLTMWQLVQVLLAVANAMQRRMGVAAEADGPPEQAQPNRFQAHGRRQHGGDGFHGVQQCNGHCCVCGAPCIRLERGHKHCKCNRHLHTS